MYVFALKLSRSSNLFVEALNASNLSRIGFHQSENFADYSNFEQDFYYWSSVEIHFFSYFLV